MPSPLCLSCFGSGTQHSNIRRNEKLFTIPRTCPVCNGSGKRGTKLHEKQLTTPEPTTIIQAHHANSSHE